ncbi:hypothetical protein [Yersinia entomophaga]|nr:hypothetical protein [Yersinia entomophaga]OWF84786.1 hypothetical protein B4914_18690 [Yersinia entomophaga]
MDDVELKNKLIALGMKQIDAGTLIKLAKYKKTSVSWQFFLSLSGLYWYSLCIILTYLFFINKMDSREIITFSAIYLPGLVIMYIFTPFFKKLFWSFKVLFSLGGR